MRRKLHDAMQLDKKVSGGNVKFVLAQSIGKVQYGQKVPADPLERVLENL
jgi:3-dehydroquinate synthetase